MSFLVFSVASVCFLSFFRYRQILLGWLMSVLVGVFGVCVMVGLFVFWGGCERFIFASCCSSRFFWVVFVVVHVVDWSVFGLLLLVFSLLLLVSVCFEVVCCVLIRFWYLWVLVSAVV